MVSSLALLLLLPLVSSFPLVRRAYQGCGQYDTIPAGEYTIDNNLWGGATATYGWQCSRLDSVNGDTVKWTTKFEWEGGDKIKSCANAQLNEELNKQLGRINSMPTSWEWYQTGNNIVSDTVYDLFTSSSAGGSNLNEIMVWLSAYDSKPISYQYDSDGGAIPIATNLDFNGHVWDLYQGSNGYNQVLTFAPADGQPIKSFSGDLNPFFQHLTDNGYVSSSEWLKTAQGGVEVTSGAGKFVTTSYTLTIN